MQLLLDTHTLIWWLVGDPALPAHVRQAIDDPSHETFASAASAWEIATKHRIGKLPSAAVIAADVEGHVIRQGFKTLAVTFTHGQAAGALPGLHRDPFDRMLIAQAIIEDLTLVSNEKVFDAYGVKRLW